MNKAILVTGVVAAGVVAAGAGTMIVSNGQIDKMVDNISESTPAPFTVEVLEDSDSFASRELVLSVGADELPDFVNLILKNNIQKRPWGTSIDHELTFGESLLDMASEDEAELIRSLFIDNPVVTGTTNVSMTGGYNTEISSLEYSGDIDDEVNLNLNPIVVNITGNASGKLDMEGNWPGMTISELGNPENEFNLLPLSFSAKGKYVTSQLFVGEQTFNLEGFTFSDESDYDSTKISFAGLDLTSTADVDGDDYRADMKLTGDLLNFNANDEEVNVDDIVFSMGFSGLNTEGLQQLLEGVNEMSSTGLPGEGLMEGANKVLQNGFEINFNEIGANYNGSSISMDASLVIPANDQVDVNNPFSLMGLVTEISASANLSMDLSVAEIPALSEMVMPLMMTGSLQESGDQYVMNFTMENGEALLNGDPIPLPF